MFFDFDETAALEDRLGNNVAAALLGTLLDTEGMADRSFGDFDGGFFDFQTFGLVFSAAEGFAAFSLLSALADVFDAL